MRIKIGNISIIKSSVMQFIRWRQQEWKNHTHRKDHCCRDTLYTEIWIGPGGLRHRTDEVLRFFYAVGG